MALTDGLSGIVHSWFGPGWTPAQIPDLRGKTALVTGANSGMGFETTRKLAENGAEVIMLTRKFESGQEAANRIKSEVAKDAKLQVIQCDFMSLREVADVVRQVKRATNKLDILVDMAGVFYPTGRGKSAEGIEETLAVNYFAPFVLVDGLLDTLRAAPRARVVLMTSGVSIAGHINWNDLKGETSITSGLVPYGTSKLYLTMYAKELSRRVPDIDVFPVHPGLVATPLHEKSDPRYPLNLVFKACSALVGSTPKYGAYSALYAATEPSLTGKRLAFFAPSLIAFNLWPTTERPWWLSGRVGNDRNCEKLFDMTQDIVEQILGAAAPPRLPPAKA